MVQIVAKFQLGASGMLSGVAAVKLSCSRMSAVGMPRTPAPPALRTWPEAVVSQKLLLTVPPFMKPTRPPTGTAPATAPDE